MTDKTTSNDNASALESRLDQLERSFNEERQHMHKLYEAESKERRKQFGLVLNELCQAVEKMERRDIEIETALRTELTKQNRFIYEEFQESVENLNNCMRSEARRLQDSIIDRQELAQTVRALMEESELTLTSPLFS
jgi:hypothetical protein